MKKEVPHKDLTVEERRLESCRVVAGWRPRKADVHLCLGVQVGVRLLANSGLH